MPEATSRHKVRLNGMDEGRGSGQNPPRHRFTRCCPCRQMNKELDKGAPVYPLLVLRNFPDIPRLHRSFQKRLRKRNIKKNSYYFERINADRNQRTHHACAYRVHEAETRERYPLPDCPNTCVHAFVLAAVTDDRTREAVRTPTGEQGC